MYVTTTILALEAGHAFKRKLPWVAPFTLVSLVTTVETVNGKRLKCDRSLRRSIFCGVSSLLLFLPGLGVPGGGGMGKSE